MTDTARDVARLEVYPANWVRKPPGMVWEDWQAWAPFLRDHGGNWSGYSYDVELYTQPMPATETDPAIIRMWLRNTAKRIDAVGWVDDRADIFEARRFAGWSAIAQLLGYRDLWNINFPSVKLGKLYLITESIDDVTRATAARQGIVTWVVGEPLPT